MKDESSKDIKHTITILVENHAGVLSRVSGLFSRRGFNIDSLAVGVTNDPAISRITIVASGDENTVEQIQKQLLKLMEVLYIKRLRDFEIISRELILIKVACSPETRGKILDISQAMNARICDISAQTIMLEQSDTAQRIEILKELLEPYGILEIARTGTIALEVGGLSDTTLQHPR